jgi:hypothetical protein
MFMSVQHDIFTLRHAVRQLVGSVPHLQNGLLGLRLA